MGVDALVASKVIVFSNKSEFAQCYAYRISYEAESNLEVD